MILATVDDDDVFDAAADEQFTITHVSKIARMQPPISNRLGSQCLVVEVTEHQRRSRECDFADRSLVHRPPVLVHNADSVARQWATTAHNSHALRVSPLCKCGDSAL